MTRQEWCDTMADELNKAGFKARGFNNELGRWEDNYELYECHEPETFILGVVDGEKEINYLKTLGLLNNGRCPMCGNPIKGNPSRFTNGHNHNMHFQICQNCVNGGRRNQRALGINNYSSYGCVVALLMLSLNIITGFIKKINRVSYSYSTTYGNS